MNDIDLDDYKSVQLKLELEGHLNSYEGKGKGDYKMKGQVFDAVLIRQKKPVRRKNGERIAFMDNAVALLKDDKGNPKGTQIKGPMAKEVSDRWQFLGKICKYVV